MYDPNDYRAQRRYERQQRRAQRQYSRYQNPMRGIAGGIFVVALIFAFALNSTIGGPSFLVLLFVGLAFFSLIGSFSSFKRQGIYGGFQGFVWLLGLALCFWIGFWPWILVPLAASMFLGALINPIMAGLASTSFLSTSQPQQPPYQQQPYQPYGQGYQTPPPPPPTTYQEGGQPYPYNQAPKQEFQHPEAEQTTEQELPPMEQH